MWIHLTTGFAVLFGAAFPHPLAAQIHLGNLTSYSIEGKSMTLRADTSAVRIVSYRADIMRVDFLPSPVTVLDPSVVVIRDTGEGETLTVVDEGPDLRVSTSGATVVCSKTPLRLAFSSPGGGAVLKEGATGGCASNGQARSAAFALAADDHFYGTGERGTDLDKRGQTFGSYNDTFFGYTSGLPRMNINVPFLASTRGYALYFENTYPGTFDLGYANPTLFSYTASGGELSYFVILAPTIPMQLEEYTWLTGRQPLPPRWAFGYIQSKYGYQSETEARAMVQMMRQEQIPCDAIVLDLYWYRNMGDLAWNTDSWPTPFQMMADFLKTGVRTIVITEPYVTSLSSTFADAAAIGFLGRTSGGDVYRLNNWWSCGCDAGLFDMTNPAARAWWWNKHPAFMGTDSAGVAGLWTDLGEPESHPLDMQHLLGSTAKIHNIYNLLWAQAVYEGYGTFRPGERIFNLTRSGYAGIQRFGAIPWSADVGNTFGGLAAQLPMLLSMGMSGLVYHNSDIGGFCCGATSPELYVRWMQYGTFCPIMRAHGTGRATEPWGYGAQAETIARSYIQLRYQLLPYIYTMAHESYASAIPLARPLLFDAPGDPSILDESGTYRWGDAFLVSPVVVQSQSSKAVPLPAGDTWIDYWTGRRYGGGQTITVPTPLETLPLFVRGGSIIPMQPVMDYSDQRPLDTLLLAVYPLVGVDGEFTLYEDDGKTLGYQTGACALTQLSESLTGATLTISIGQSQGNYSGKPQQRVYLSAVHGIAQNPASVSTNGNPVPQQPSYASLRQGRHGFFFDSLSHILYIQTPSVPDSSYGIQVQQVQLTSVGPAGGSPIAFRLEQNFPNPFNPETSIRFSIPTTGRTTLRVYDVLGKEVATLLDRPLNPGTYAVTFDGSRLSSGVYFLRLISERYEQTRKMILAK